jgi:predicted deacylase
VNAEPEKVKASTIKPMWTPRSPVVASQCATCPFGPNGHKLKDAADALVCAKNAADMGLDFHCHSTVYENVLSETKAPTVRPQAEWRVCAGAVKYKREQEVEKRKAWLRQRGLLIEDE